MATVTTRQIAAACGFGQSTVSMALRNDSRIPDETRDLIRRAAEQLGYQPDPHYARMMSSVKRRSVSRSLQPIAFLLPWPSATNYFRYKTYREFRAGAQARAEEFGYTLEDFLIGPEHVSPSRLAQILRTRAIPGILIAPASLTYETGGTQGLNLELQCENHALSTIGYSIREPQAHRVTHDHASGAIMATEALRARGRRRVGLVTSHAVHVRVGGRWLAGSYVADFELDRQSRIPPLVMDHIRDDKVFKRWFEKHKPDALVTVEFDEVLDHLARMGVACPDDVSIAHLDAGSYPLPCAGIDQCSERIGAAAFDVLLAQILRNERGLPVLRRTVMLEGKWIDGPTAPSAVPPAAT